MTMKMTISMNPNTASCLNCTAHGNKKIVSTSKIRNNDVEADRKALTGVAHRLDTALVRLQLAFLVTPGRTDDATRKKAGDGEHAGGDSEQRNRKVRGHSGSASVISGGANEDGCNQGFSTTG